MPEEALRIPPVPIPSRVGSDYADQIKKKVLV
jgi:hypothetical protein